jgi:transglutaminase-like putative cysteine protease
MTKSPDFERLRIVQRGYRVVEHNPEGYLVSTSAPLQATVTQLDHRYRPIKLTMAGVFDVTATDRATALALHSLPRKTSYLIPIDQRIADHMNVASLTLRLANPPAGLDSRLDLMAGTTTSDGDINRYLGEELRFPITDPQIQTLVQRLQSQNRDRTAVLATLVGTAHRQLEYVEDAPAGTVLKALARGTGECTDFADLLTTLARAAGYPARTVYGLAYRDGARPAFMMHAWNEIKLDDDQPWTAVDPTWNQTRTDATHIPLSEAQAAAMVLAASTGPIEFELEAVTYF